MEGADMTVTAEYTSPHFVTWRIFAPVTPTDTARKEAGWVATDGVRTFGILDGEDAWTENDDLIGYHFGVIDDGTTAVKTSLGEGLPALPIGPNADPKAKVNTPDPTDAEFNEFANTVGMFVDHGRKPTTEPAAAAPEDTPEPTPAG